MLTTAQLSIRQTGITSTDITRIVGESPYGGPCDVYADKIATIDHEPQKSTVAQRIGNYLEPLVLELIAEHFKVDIARNTDTIRSHVWPWLLATPDGISGIGPSNNAVAEAKVKTVTFQDRDAWLDDAAPPPWVHVQCQWHCLARAVPVCYAGALIGATPRFWIVESDPDMASALIEAGQGFYEAHVVPRRPPPVDGTDGARRMLAAVWPRAKAATIKASPDVEAHARAYFEAHEAEKRAAAAKSLASQELIAYAGEHERVEGDGWRLLLGNREATRVEAHERKPYRAFDCRPVKKK